MDGRCQTCTCRSELAAELIADLWNKHQDAVEFTQSLINNDAPDHDINLNAAISEGYLVAWNLLNMQQEGA